MKLLRRHVQFEGTAGAKRLAWLRSVRLPESTEFENREVGVEIECQYSGGCIASIKSNVEGSEKWSWVQFVDNQLPSSQLLQLQPSRSHRLPTLRCIHWQPQWQRQLPGAERHAIPSPGILCDYLVIDLTLRAACVRRPS